MSVNVTTVALGMDIDMYEINQSPTNLTLTLKCGATEIEINNIIDVRNLRQMCDQYIKIHDDAAGANEDYAHDLNNWLSRAGWAGA